VKRSNTYVGRPVERVEDLRFLTGKGQYVGDLQFPNQLHAKVLRSSVAHGIIRSIDFEKAAQLEGICGIITSEAFSVVPTIPLRTEMKSLRNCAQPVIAKGIVRYVGEPVAIVIAESEEQAEDASEEIRVDIDRLDAIVDWSAATSKDCRTFLNEKEGNIAARCIAKKGDAAAIFSDAPYRRRERFVVHRQAAMPMETRGLVATWDASRSHLTMYGAAKTPFFSRKSLAALLGIPESTVDYIECDVGGGFGARGEIHPEDFLVAHAARLYGRPVRWIEDRREHFQAMNHARDVASDLEIALDREGRLLGIRGVNYVNIGAYARPSCIVAIENSGMFVGGGYRIPNIFVESFGILSNKVPSGVYRGPGRLESNFFFERLMDMCADDLSIDPIEIRLKNLIRSDEMPYQLPASNEAEPGYLDSGHYPSTLSACALKFGWNQRRKDSGVLRNGKYYGAGCACFVEGGGAGPKENARMELRRDGGVDVFVGSSALGQGLETVLSQIAADALEIPLSRISIFHGSTNIIHEGFGSNASRSTVMGGSAVISAAEALLASFRNAAAARLGVDVESISVSGGVALAADGRTLTLEELAVLELKSEGSFSSNRRTYSYGAAMAYVSVEAGTGMVRVVDYVVVDDVGRIINPLTLHGQTVGAAVQGLGGALSEELVYDQDGQLLIGTFSDYVTPVAGDYRDISITTTEEFPSPNNPLGAKGAGEGGIIPVGGAIGNAVSAALKPFHANVRELPLTPNRVWSLMEQGK
jgi:aerobic carbon-monoxide dehydrogenase large subunit